MPDKLNLRDEDRPFDEEDFEEPRPRMMPKIIAVISFVLFAGVIWYAYQQGQRVGSEEVAPLVRAEPGPTRIRPEEPGGMEIPNQDKTIYGLLNEEEQDIAVEKLMPAPEEPVTVPESDVVEEAPMPQGTSPEKPSIESLLKAPEPAPQPEAMPSRDAPVVMDDALQSLPSSAPEVTEAPKSEAAPAATEKAEPAKKEPAPAKATAASGDKVFRIQMAAFRSEEQASVAWKAMVEKHKPVLGSLQMHVNKTSGDKGTFYRLQAGPFANRADAEKACSELKKRDQGCFVVAP